MLTDEISRLYKKFRLYNYRELFGRIREKDGSLSATEAFAADVIYLLDKPTITQLADTLGISQPNATYKVGNLVAKGYITKTVCANDRRECVLQAAEKFHRYYDTSDSFISDAVERLRCSYGEKELRQFEHMLCALNEELTKSSGE